MQDTEAPEGKGLVVYLDYLHPGLTRCGRMARSQRLDKLAAHRGKVKLTSHIASFSKSLTPFPKRKQSPSDLGRGREADLH